MKASMIKAGLGALSDLIVPLTCAICGEALRERRLCRACEDELPWTDIVCKRCGKPLPVGTHCAECQRRAPPFDKAVAPLLYRFPVDAALKSLKFRRQLFYAPAFGELLLPLIGKSFRNVDALLPVPLHPRRQAVRGFNQAAELCGPLRKQTGLPIVRNVHRIRYTKPQTGLDAAERRRNMRAAFVVRGRLECCRPLIVDDVMTTGETCRQLSLTLLDAGAKSVYVLAVARAA